MAEDVKKRLLEYNKMRESRCLLEGKSEMYWLRPQKKHYPQSNRASLENYKEEKQEYDSGRTSWIKITPPNKEKRHFPEKNISLLIQEAASETFWMRSKISSKKKTESPVASWKKKHL